MQSSVFPENFSAQQFFRCDRLFAKKHRTLTAADKTSDHIRLGKLSDNTQCVHFCFKLFIKLKRITQNRKNVRPKEKTAPL